jgi:hypothetical protein
MTNPIPAERRDLLLGSARILVTLILAMVCLIGLGLIGAAIVLPMFPDRILAEIAPQIGKGAGSEVVVAIELLFALFLAMGALAVQWLRLLRRVIDSVRLGNAFASENAGRLSNMGWLTVATEVLSIKTGAVAAYLAKQVENLHLDVGMSVGGILLALVLFILARVFREGAAMRADLEGTV